MATKHSFKRYRPGKGVKGKTVNVKVRPVRQPAEDDVEGGRALQGLYAGYQWTPSKHSKQRAKK